MRIALYQARTGIDPFTSAAHLAGAIEGASAGGAEMLFTPEMSGTLDRDAARADGALTVEEEDVVLSAVRSAAAANGIWVQLGSLAVRRRDGRLANRALVIDAEGGVQARYDKMHLFDVDLPGGESWRESARYAAGDDAVVVNTPVGMLGLSICYDLRFPALYGALSAAGATILSVPAAFTVPTGRQHWHVLCRARAIENGCYLVAAAQCGRHEDGRETFGHSLVVGPEGEVILDLGPGDVRLGFAEIDSDRVRDARRSIPVLSHRRLVGPARVAS